MVLSAERDNEGKERNKKQCDTLFTLFCPFICGSSSSFPGIELSWIIFPDINLRHCTDQCIQWKINEDLKIL